MDHDYGIGTTDKALETRAEVRFGGGESAVPPSLSNMKARLGREAVRDVILAPVDCQSPNSIAKKAPQHKPSKPRSIKSHPTSLPIATLFDSEAYDRFHRILNLPSSSKAANHRVLTATTPTDTMPHHESALIDIQQTICSPSASPPTSTLTRDVPAYPEEPLAAVDVDPFTFRASIPYFSSPSNQSSPKTSSNNLGPPMKADNASRHIPPCSESDPDTCSNPSSHRPNTKKLYFQWNIRGLWCNHAELCHIVLQNPPIAIGLQEMMTCNVSNSLRNQYKWNLANRHYTQGAGAAGLGILHYPS